MKPRCTHEAPLATPEATGCAESKSHRYTARGERVDPGGGLYWIPASEFHTAVETARREPATLNRYRFEPLDSCPKRRA